jgi:uncharacterized protein YjbI with pentapeptide repeats
MGIPGVPGKSQSSQKPDVHTGKKPDVDPHESRQTGTECPVKSVGGHGVSSPSPQLSIEEILSRHREWLSSGRLNGAQAHLAHADLKGADLKGMDLSGADLSDADLSHADLKNADLADASLIGARLCNADLDNAKGLTLEQLAGSNLRGARLPSTIKDSFDRLSSVDDHSKIASGVFVTLLAGCLYCWLTVGSATDITLIADSDALALPIINTRVSIVSFYLAAPAILLALFLYFHIYLQRLWEKLARLPATFPDGTVIDQKIFPWLMNSLIRLYPTYSGGSGPALLRLQGFLLQVLGWWLVPITMLLLWGRCLVRHDWVLTGVQLIMVAISTAAATGFSNLRFRTLTRHATPSRLLQPVLATVTAGSLLLLMMISREVIDGSLLRGVGVITAYERHVKDSPDLISGALTGDPLTQLRLLKWFKSVRFFRREADWSDRTKDQNACRAPCTPLGSVTFVAYPGTGWSISRTSSRNNDGTWLQQFNYEFHYQIVADLVGADLSSKPPNWTGRSASEDAELPQVKGARLRGSDLRWANADGAFLVNADLTSAQLAYANLDHADLRRSRLDGAILTKCSLEAADLRGATIVDADFSGAVLAAANVAGVDFSDAVGLEPTQVKTARNWFLAKYGTPGDFGLPDDHNERVKFKDLRSYKLDKLSLAGADFRNADLSGADLRDSHVPNADFSSAKLSGTCLAGADLALADGLVEKQIEDATVDEHTLCPAPLRDRCRALAKRKQHCP